MNWKKMISVIIFLLIGVTTLLLSGVAAQSATSTPTIQPTETPTQIAIPTPVPIAPGVVYLELATHLERVTSFSLKTITIILSMLSLFAGLGSFASFKSAFAAQETIVDAKNAVQDTKNAVNQLKQYIESVETRVQTLDVKSKQSVVNLEETSNQLTEQFEAELSRLSEDIRVSMLTTYRLQHLQEIRDPIPRIRLRALMQLANISDASIVSIMIERLTSDKDTDVRAEAAFSLGKILGEGGWDGEVIQGAEEALLQGLENENESIKDEAIQALKKLACADVPLSRAVYRQLRQITNDDTSSEKFIQIAQEILEYLGG